MKYKYIASIPKSLLNDFLNHRVIPFIGAGFSKNADIPKGFSMPDWNELGKHAAEEIPNYSYDNNAIDALSYYEELYSRAKLVEFLMQELHFGKILPRKTYKVFCDLFTGSTICTTNFDSLVEEEMTLLQRPVSVIVTEDRLAVNSNGESKIIKLHGDFNHPDKMVITEHDYDVYLEKNPIFSTYIANLFITNTMLLIGYSLDDNDFRSIWQIINSRLGSMTQPAYCITVGATPEKITKYKRRNIRVINLKGHPQNYRTILHDLFVELKDYIDGEKDKEVTSTNERINEQMIIPAEDNRLCFISCNMSRIAQLSALLYPILRNLGITAVRIDDMLMPGENWIDISRAAIRKSKAAIIDISDSSPSVMLELGLIRSTKPSQNILLICEEGTTVPFALSDQKVLFYSFDGTSDKNTYHFTKMLREWGCSVFRLGFNYCDNIKNRTFEDAYRLFEKEEYSACIVSAYSELEYLIYSRHIKHWASSHSNFVFRFNLYLKDNLSFKELNVDEYISLRNKIVHMRYVATRKEACDFLHFIEIANKNDCKLQE